MKRQDIRLKWFNQTGGAIWLNSQDEPDIDYVQFLEDEIIKLSQNVSEKSSDICIVICF